MKQKTLKELEENYEMQLDKAISEIKKSKAKIVLLQFPDGLKPYATAIVEHFEKHFPDVNFLIWLEKCYGACDIPVLGKELEKKIDLVIQFGHNEMMPLY